STIFTNYTGNDFRLTSNTTAGLNLTAQPWWNGGTDSFFGTIDSVVDMYGVTRTTWSRGAYEYYSGQPTAPLSCTSFTYSTWGTCTNGTQTRAVLTSSPSGCTGGSPITTQSCMVTPTPTTGICSASLNQCSAGIFSDQADTTTNYLWQCLGSNGGANANCSLTIPLSPDTTPPTISITAPLINATVSGAAVPLSVTATDPEISGQTRSGLLTVQFKLNNANIGAELTTAPYSGSWNTSGIPNGNHVLSAVARDLAGNRATSTIALTINNVAVSTPDITPPSIPANFSATAISASQINLSWSPSTDPAVAGAVTSGVTSYRIYRGGALLITVTGTAYSNTGLSPSTLYAYTVSAFDGAGNSSPESPSASATTQTPPSLTNNPPAPSNGSPSSALAAGTTQTAISLITDQPATCKYGTTANLTYNLQPSIFTTTGGTTHSTAIANLANGSTYVYYVRCDSAGSATTGDYIISFSVSAPALPLSGGGGGGSSGGGGGTLTPAVPPTSGTSTPPVISTSTSPTVPSLTGSFTPIVTQLPIISSFTNYIQAQKALLKKLDPALTKRLQGRILLQVQERGQAWYLDPLSQKRFYLADGATAYGALRKFGLGITDKDLAKIPLGLETRFRDTDTDADGLADKLEEGLGTDANNPDTDNDGFKDGDEISQGHNPLGQGKLTVDQKLVNRLNGRIVLQVQQRGQAWYLNPADGKRYYMKDGSAAYEIMRYLSLGITNENIYQIGMGE
ncbi:MAG: Glycoside hydrolase family 9, partial [Parcubacteria group bacterium GW2011_GWA2_44_15]